LKKKSEQVESGNQRVEVHLLALNLDDKREKSLTTAQLRNQEERKNLLSNQVTKMTMKKKKFILGKL